MIDENAAVKLHERKLDPSLPVLFIRGEQDPTSPLVAAEKMQQLIPDMKVVSLDAGHWIMVQPEAKDQVTKEVLTWLKELNL